MATATTRAETSSIPTRRPIPQGLMPPRSPELPADNGGGASSPCLLRADFSLSSKEGGSSSPGASLMSAPGRRPAGKPGLATVGVGQCQECNQRAGAAYPARCVGGTDRVAASLAIIAET